MESEKCVICEFDFKAGTMTDGKCTECAKKFPDSNSMKEVIEKNNPQLKKNEEDMERRIAKSVERKLKEVGILSECECGKSFFRKSPAQKSCGSCKETD